MTTVRVLSKRFHTLFGEEHPEGSTYDAPLDQLDNLMGQGLVAYAFVAEAEPESQVLTQPNGKTRRG